MWSITVSAEGVCVCVCYDLDLNSPLRAHVLKCWSLADGLLLSDCIMRVLILLVGSFTGLRDDGT